MRNKKPRMRGNCALRNSPKRKKQLKEKSEAPTGSSSRARLHLTRAGSSTASVKDGLAGLSWDFGKVVKRSFDELDTMKNRRVKWG